MTDLTKIDKPFGLLDDETQAALRAHFGAGKPTQHYAGRGWSPVSEFLPFGEPAIAYRAAPPHSPTREELAEALRRTLAAWPPLGWSRDVHDARALLACYDKSKGDEA